MLRAILEYSGPASGLSVFHFDGDLTTPGLAQDIADAMYTFTDEIRGTISSSQSMQLRSEIYQLDEADGSLQDVASVTTLAVTGAGGEGQVGQALAALIRWRTSTVVGGRFLQGRSYIPGLAVTAQNAQGELAAAANSTLNAAATNLRGIGQLGVWSPTAGQVSLVTSNNVWSELAVQRRRRE